MYSLKRLYIPLLVSSTRTKFSRPVSSSISESNLILPIQRARAETLHPLASNIEEFVGRCFVMFFTRYTRGRPHPSAWTPDIPLYVCEFRYKDDQKSFKKIKSWNSCVPEQIRHNEYDFEPYADEHVDALQKIKSPFIRGVVGTGGLDVSEPNYNFSQDGVPTTASEAQQQDQQPMDLDVQNTQELSRNLEPLDTNGLGGSSMDTSTLANFDASTLLGASPAYLQPSTPAAAELDTTDFFTPLPSALSTFTLIISRER